MREYRPGVDVAPHHALPAVVAAHEKMRAEHRARVEQVAGRRRDNPDGSTPATDPTAAGDPTDTAADA